MTKPIDEMRKQKKFIFIAGPCVIESEAATLSIAAALQEIFSRYQGEFFFKASFDKANRTSLSSFRGPGLKKGLEILSKVKQKYGIKILSDVHSVEQVEQAKDVLDVIQIPAFLCRQTDILAAAARTGKIVNVKKGQFLSPFDMKYVVEKIERSGGRKIFLTERGSTFGYNNLVVDFRSLRVMRDLGYPVIFDATHSVQFPSAARGCSGGDRQYIIPLSRAAVAFGCDGLFMEVHPHPEKALCDGANSLNLTEIKRVVKMVEALRKTVQKIENGL